MVRTNRLWLAKYLCCAPFISSCWAATPDCGSAESKAEALKIFARMDSPETFAEKAGMKVEDSIRSVFSEGTNFDHYSLAAYLIRLKYGAEFQKDPSAIIAKINQFDWVYGFPPDGVYSLNSIRLVDRNVTTYAVMCVAIASLSAPGYGSAFATINFKVEITTEGKPYVTVYRDGDPMSPN